MKLAVKGNRLPPAGTSIATIVGVYDHGTQTTVWQGEQNVRRKLMLRFELAESAGLNDNGRRFQISRTFTASLHEKSALRLMLKALRGRDLTVAEQKSFDPRSLAGAICMISITHNEGSERTSASITGVLAAPAGATNEGSSTPETFSLDEFNADTYACLPAWQQEVIALSPEYQAVANPATGDVEF